jgi:predicted phage terminase large subunit-like protein
MRTFQEHEALWGDITQELEGPELIGAFRELCRKDLYFLLSVGLNRPDVRRQWLYERCMEVQNAPDEYLDLWSRDHYKSTVITFAKSIQDILLTHGDGATGRECTISIFSHTRPIAKGFLQQIKREFEENERLREWFPDILWDNPKKDAPKWSDDEGLIVRRKNNPKECTVQAWGLVDSQPIGCHFTHRIYDDMVTRDSVNTPEMIQKTIECLELSYNLGTRGGVQRFIGTRYHFNDPYATLMDRGTVIPRVYPATDDGTIEGNPVLLSPEELAKKRRDMGPYTFACQMMQNPIADESQGFKKDWLRYHEGMNEYSIQKMNTYILVDPANSKRKGSDYTAIWVVGLGMDGNMYIIDMVRDRLNLSQRCRMVMDFHMKYEPVRNGGVRYEKYGQSSDIEHLQSLMEQENYRFEVEIVAGSTAKTDRINRLMPLFEASRIYLPRNQYYTQMDGKTVDLVKSFVEEEYACFPVPRHDDMLDALARIAEPDLPLRWPKKGNVYQGKFGSSYANTDYNILG